MRASNIHQDINFSQVPKDRDYNMPGRAFLQLIHSLINESATKTVDGYELSIYDLTCDEQKLLLSHVVSADDYQWVCSHPSRLEAQMLESCKYLQSLFDKELDEMYHRDIYEQGYTLRRTDHGDFCTDRR